MTVVVDALATFRLARLATEDVITETPRKRLIARLELAGHDKAAYLASCPWCASVYIGAAVVIARRVAPRVWDPVARALAFSAVAGWLADR